MESRVALIGIIVENEDAVEKLNCVFTRIRQIHCRQNGYSLQREKKKIL